MFKSDLFVVFILKKVLFFKDFTFYDWFVESEDVSVIYIIFAGETCECKCNNR